MDSKRQNDSFSTSFPEGCFLLDGLSVEEKQRAIKILSPTYRTVEEGREAVSAGDPGGYLIFLLSGRMSVYRSGAEKQTLLKYLIRGDCFGAASLFRENGAAPTNVIAETECRLAMIRVDKLITVFESFPASALNYIMFLSSKVAYLNRRIRDYSATSAEEKTANLLLRESDENGVVALRNVTETIKTLNVSRASFYRSLASFLNKGIIERSNKEIRILKPDQLKGIVS